MITVESEPFWASCVDEKSIGPRADTGLSRRETWCGKYGEMEPWRSDGGKCVRVPGDISSFAYEA